MPEPRRELILQAIEADLLLVKPPTYVTQVRDVKRFRTGPYDSNLLPALSIYDEDDIQQDLGAVSSGGIEDCLLYVTIEGWLRESQVGKLSTELNRFIADVYRAMTANYQWNTLARDTRWVSTRTHVGKVGEPLAGFESAFRISYRYPYGQPDGVIP